MTRRTTFLIGYKTFFALLGLSAIVTEIAVLIERGYFTPLNFFSYFTIQTNILVFVTLLLSALALATGKEKRLDVLRSAVTVYILVVGIGFLLLLAGMEGLVLTAVPWDNAVLHYIIPAAMLVDFLIDRPKRVLSFKKSLVWLLFPVLYVTYALTRGAITGWYPYPFLNPATNGVGSVAFTVIGLFVLGLVLIAVVTWLTATKKRFNA